VVSVTSTIWLNKRDKTKNIHQNSDYTIFLLDALFYRFVFILPRSR